MSVAEIKAELSNLSPAELAELEIAVQQAKRGLVPQSSEPLSQFFGCTRGSMTFLPGWDKPEPVENWNALRDDLPL